MKKIRKVIFQNSLAQSLKGWSQRNTLPGFDGVPMYDVFSFTLMEFKRDALSVRAASIAFRFLLSMFPAMLVIFTIIPFIPIDGFGTSLLNQLKAIMPHDAFSLISSSISEIMTKQHSGVLTIGIVMSLNFSVGAVMNMMNSFDKAYSGFRKRTGTEKILVALKITALLFLLFFISVALVILGGKLIHWLMTLMHAKSSLTYWSFQIMKWITIVFTFYLGISLIYFYGPAVHARWRFFSAGSTLAALLSILVSVLFSIFVNNFSRFNQIFGSIGTFIVIMLWMFYNALALLIGFELNASIDINKRRIDEKKFLEEAE